MGTEPSREPVIEVKLVGKRTVGSESRKTEGVRFYRA